MEDLKSINFQNTYAPWTGDLGPANVFANCVLENQVFALGKRWSDSRQLRPVVIY
jgi:hypothetical protein